MSNALHNTPGSIFELFNEIGIINQLSRAFLEERLPDGVLSTHFSVLNHLIRVNDGTTPKRIASAFQVPKNSMTHTLAGLEARGLIEMRPHETDKRSKTIWITDAGRQFRDEAIATLARDMLPILPEMDASDLAQTTAFLRHVREVLDKARD
ncbi:MAG: MarR family transcriptional regulator [Pseudomonadota bacterium]